MTCRRLFTASLLVSIALLPVVHAQQPPAKPQDEFVSVDQLPPQEQLPAAPLLITAYAIVWLGIGGYLIGLSRRLGAVAQEIERLEADVKRGHRT